MQMRNLEYRQRTAFVLNANAKNVSDRLIRRLVPMIPAGDLYCSSGMLQANEQFKWILEKGYGQVFSGGGDGTIVATINILNMISSKYRLQLPKIGILKLGTGNALASVLGAEKATRDVRHIINGGRIAEAKIGMVLCEDGTMAPFAGMGHDASVLNDYIAIKKRFQDTKLKPIVCSVLGYALAALTMSIPRQLSMARKPNVVITSSQPCKKLVHHDGKDVEVNIPAGTVLYQGPAPVVSVGSIKVFGCNFTMFPFMGGRSDCIQLRVSSCPMPTLLANMYPIWKGTFRHPDLHDFLVRDAIVESDSPMPYQIGGDACGYRSRAVFRASNSPIDMVQLVRPSSWGKHHPAQLSFQQH